MTLSELADAMDMLRARGVAKYRDIAGGGFEVEFWPAPPPDEKPKAAKPAEDKCRCGHHADDEHLQGLCIRGCDPLVCSPEEKK